MGASQIEHKHNACNLICDLIPNLNNKYYNSLEEEDDITVVAGNKSPENRESKDPMHQEIAYVERREDDNTCETTMTNERRLEAPVFPTRQKVWEKKVAIEDLKGATNAETIYQNISRSSNRGCRGNRTLHDTRSTSHRHQTSN